MSSFIGIQVPQELRSEITHFCRERQYVSTEPHIKLLPSVLMESVHGALHKLEAFCLSQSEFQVVVAEPNTRGNQVLFLTVLDGAINQVRDRLVNHFQIIGASSVYRPHVTLMRQYAGRTTMDLSRHLEEARQTFVKPYTFEAAQVTLYTRDSPEEVYRPMATIPFIGR